MSQLFVLISKAASQQLFYVLAKLSTQVKVNENYSQKLENIKFIDIYCAKRLIFFVKLVAIMSDYLIKWFIYFYVQICQQHCINITNDNMFKDNWSVFRHSFKVLYFTIIAIYFKKETKHSTSLTQRLKHMFVN